MMGCLEIGDPQVTMGFNSLKWCNDLDGVKGVPGHLTSESSMKPALCFGCLGKPSNLEIIEYEVNLIFLGIYICIYYKPYINHI